MVKKSREELEFEQWMNEQVLRERYRALLEEEGSITSEEARVLRVLDAQERAIERFP